MNKIVKWFDCEDARILPNSYDDSHPSTWYVDENGNILNMDREYIMILDTSLSPKENENLIRNWLEYLYRYWTTPTSIKMVMNNNTVIYNHCIEDKEPIYECIKTFINNGENIFRNREFDFFAYHNNMIKQMNIDIDKIAIFTCKEEIEDILN